MVEPAAVVSIPSKADLTPELEQIFRPFAADKTTRLKKVYSVVSLYDGLHLKFYGNQRVVFRAVVCSDPVPATIKPTPALQQLFGPFGDKGPDTITGLAVRPDGIQANYADGLVALFKPTEYDGLVTDLGYGKFVAAMPVELPMI